MRRWLPCPRCGDDRTFEAGRAGRRACAVCGTLAAVRGDRVVVHAVAIGVAEPPSAVPSVVEAIEQHLADARRGEILGVAIVSSRRGRCVGHGWTLGDGVMADLIAGTVWLQRQLSEAS